MFESKQVTIAQLIELLNGAISKGIDGKTPVVFRATNREGTVASIARIDEMSFDLMSDSPVLRVELSE